MTTINVEETPQPSADTVVVASGDSSTAIAQIAATAAVAEVTAVAASEVATEAAQTAERVAERQETEWRLNQETFSALEERMGRMEAGLLDIRAMLTTPTEDEPLLSDVIPPVLEMEVSAPPQVQAKKQTGLFSRNLNHSVRST